jgi:hypothetical protein
MIRLFTAAALVLMAGGCSDDNPPLTPPSDYYLGITFSPPGVVVARGGTATVNVVITRGAFYPGAVTLTVEGLPANVTGSFVPTTLASGGSNSVLTISASAEAAVGSCAFTIRATGPDVDPVVTPTISCAVTQ